MYEIKTIPYQDVIHLQYFYLRNYSNISRIFLKDLAVNIQFKSLMNIMETVKLTGLCTVEKCNLILKTRR
jgi:hypothetical protein